MGRVGRERPSQCSRAIDGQAARVRLPSLQVYSMRMVVCVLSPHHGLRINFMPAPVAAGLCHRYFSFLAPRALVRVQQHLALFTQRGTATLARWMLELEVPFAPADRTP